MSFGWREKKKKNQPTTKNIYMLSVLEGDFTSLYCCFSVRIMGVMLTVYLVLEAVLRLY